MFLIKFALCALLAQSCEAGSSIVLNKTMDLHRDLLYNYADYIRPGLGSAGPLVVNATFYLTSLNDIDEIRGEMDTVGYLNVAWIEDRMTWNPADYEGIASVLFSADKVWKPPLVLGNPSLKLSNLEDLNPKTVLVRIFYTGLAIWNPGDVFNIACSYNIYSYPFDTQTCQISVLPWSYTDKEILIQTPQSTVITSFYHDTGEWTLKSTDTETQTSNSLSIAFFGFTFQRKSEFFVVNIILPIVFLSFLNCMVYLIPSESGERISYAITVFLSFAVFITLVNDNIPKTSAPMSLLCYYLIYIFIGSVLIVISTIFNMKIAYRNASVPIPTAYRTLTNLGNPCQFVQSKFKTNPNKIHGSDVDSINEISNGDGVNTTQYNTAKDESNINIDITWQNVASAIDKLSFVVFNIYFIVGSIGYVLVFINA